MKQRMEQNVSVWKEFGIGKTESLLIVSAAITFIYFRFFSTNSLVIIILSFIVGVWLAFRPSEWAVKGLGSASRYLGFSAYITGVLSSIASNTPEAVISGLTAYKGFVTGDVELLEISVISILAAAGFNILLLGLVVMLITQKNKGKPVKVPKQVIQNESELMRWTIVALAAIFVLGVSLILLESTNLLRVQSEILITSCLTGTIEVSPATAFYLYYHLHSLEHLSLPRIAGLVMFLSYILYTVFMFKRSKSEKKEEAVIHVEGGLLSRRGTMIMVILGFAGIFLGGEILTTGVETAMETLNIASFGEPVLIISFLLGFAGAVPEHGIALVAAHKGRTELSLGNLLGGVLQTILLIIGGISMIVPMPINLFTLFQIAIAAATMWFLKRAIMDDEKIDFFEGLMIALIQGFVFILMLFGGV